MGNLLASVDDLALSMGEDLDPAEARHALRLASGEVRAATGLAFDYTEDAVAILNGSGGRILLLPELPVLAVVSVVENPGPTEKTLTLPGSTSPAVEWDADGILERIDGGRFARRRRYYRVVYDFGFEIIPDEVQAVVLRIAARGLSSPAGGALRQETLGRYSYTLAGENAGIGLYAADLADLSAYMIGNRMREGTASTTGSGSGS